MEFKANASDSHSEVCGVCMCVDACAWNMNARHRRTLVVDWKSLEKRGAAKTLCARVVFARLAVTEPRRRHPTPHLLPSPCATIMTLSRRLRVIRGSSADDGQQLYELRRGGRRGEGGWGGMAAAPSCMNRHFSSS